MVGRLHTAHFLPGPAQGQAVRFIRPAAHRLLPQSLLVGEHFAECALRLPVVGQGAVLPFDGLPDRGRGPPVRLGGPAGGNCPLVPGGWLARCLGRSRAFGRYGPRACGAGDERRGTGRQDANRPDHPGAGLRGDPGEQRWEFRRTSVAQAGESGHRSKRPVSGAKATAWTCLPAPHSLAQLTRLG